MLLSRLAPVLTLLGALLAWEAMCVVFAVPSFVLPRPSQIITAAQEVPLGTWLENIAATLQIQANADPAKLRDAVQTVTLLALRAVGVMDARARGLVVQAVLPAKALMGA